jgi:hypothetical protein
MIRNNIAIYATTLGGGFLVVAGLIGFCFPHFPVFQLGVLINLTHLASGLLAVYLGLKSASLPAVRNSCVGIGAFYSVLGLIGSAGLAMGGLGNTLVHLLVGASFFAAAAIQPLPSTIGWPS